MTITDCYAGLRVTIANGEPLQVHERVLVGEYATVQMRTPHGCVWLQLDRGGEALLPVACLDYAQNGPPNKPKPMK